MISTLKWVLLSLSRSLGIGVGSPTSSGDLITCESKRVNTKLGVSESSFREPCVSPDVILMAEA
jgi:hypothetical protein